MGFAFLPICLSFGEKRQYKAKVKLSVGMTSERHTKGDINFLKRDDFEKIGKRAMTLYQLRVQLLIVILK